MGRIMGAGLWLAVMAAAAAAETYYVAPDGDDAHPGTEEKPWKTLRKASASVNPGDTVLIKAGEYSGRTGQSAWRVDKAGTQDAPITYKAFGNGEVRIHNGRILSADQWKHVKGAVYSRPVDPKERIVTVFQNHLPLHYGGKRLPIRSVDEMIPNSSYRSGETLYVWLEDGSDPAKSVMRITGSHVIELSGCDYTVFDGLTVEFGFNGIKEQNDARHVTVRNCTLRSLFSQGIQPVPEHCVIERNVFRNIGVDKFKHALYGSSAGIIVRNNVFEEIAGAAVHLYGTPESKVGGWEISGNLFRKPRPMTTRSSNKYYGEMILWARTGNLVFNNVFYGEGKRDGISLIGGNCVFNNTFVGCPTAIGFHRETGNQVLNNIFLDSRRGFLSWPAELKEQTFENNLYFNAEGSPRWEHAGTRFTTFEEYQKASGESKSRYADPLLTGPADARPKEGSPAIDAGIVRKFFVAVRGVEREVAVDIEGTPRPQGSAPDIGAYEVKAAK